MTFEQSSGRKFKQFCSVCKEWLDMEVVPTSDGDEDDGVIWFRCPTCQGFLPKLSGADADSDDPSPGSGTAVAAVTGVSVANEAQESSTTGANASKQEASGSPFLPEDETADDPAEGSDAHPEPSGDPIAEYAELLAAADASDPTSYRPWGNYEVGECLHHLAWDDCGVVVSKEKLPGGRCVIKCYFENAGVVRLIEQEPQ